MAEPDRLTWLGHATILAELDGARILTDPLLRRRPMHLRRHVPDPDPEALRRLDAVFISHLHLDHLDVPSLRRLGTDVRLIVPRGAGGGGRRAGFAPGEEGAEGRGGWCVVRAPPGPRGPRGATRCGWAGSRSPPGGPPTTAPACRAAPSPRPWATCSTAAAASTSPATPRCTRRCASSATRGWTSRCCRSGDGARGWGPATWIRTRPRGPSRSWSR